MSDLYADAWQCGCLYYEGPMNVTALAHQRPNPPSSAAASPDTREGVCASAAASNETVPGAGHIERAKEEKRCQGDCRARSTDTPSPRPATTTRA